MNLARCMAALYLIEILHQTTTSSRARARLLCCILLKFYIKPQQPFTRSRYSKLYLIEILHQTTTCGKCEDCLRRLYLIEILHQTTTPALASMPLCRCILLKFYIKPQLVSSLFVLGAGCILLKFYIKPQLRLERELAYCVVSYRNSTSNHNAVAGRHYLALLYLIEILHQTTTLVECVEITSELYLIEILHQTTTRSYLSIPVVCCILSKFYIKPQLQRAVDNNRYVVSYRNSTSNHNHMTIVLYFYGLYLIEILHQTTTICFHDIFSSLLYLIEILHQTTTEDWGSIKKHWLYLIEILHQTTTAAAVFKIAKGCILSKFYIKPQLRLERELARCSCILSKFYIKPQLSRIHSYSAIRCILSKFYIKPQQSPLAYCPPGGCILSKFYIKPQRYVSTIFSRPCCILSKFYIKPQQRTGAV